MTDRTESNVPKKSPLSLQMDLSKVYAGDGGGEGAAGGYE